jgi:hypothetical protein
VWLVPNLIVWGQIEGEVLDYLCIENGGDTPTVLFGQASPDYAIQEVRFADLIDHRGNRLPETIARPFVVPRSRSEHSVVILGDELPTSFRIGRDPTADGAIQTDLLVVELGANE